MAELPAAKWRGRPGLEPSMLRLGDGRCVKTVDDEICKVLDSYCQPRGELPDVISEQDSKEDFRVSHT